jgi:hypothetical protein
MRLPVLLVLIPFVSGAGLPAHASPCGEQVQAFGARLNDMAETSASLSTGGKAVAAAREGQAVQADPSSTATRAPAIPKDPPNEDAVRKAARTGAGGDGIMQAMAALNRARMLDQEGNVAGCNDALVAAKQLAGPGQ